MEKNMKFSHHDYGMGVQIEDNPMCVFVQFSHLCSSFRTAVGAHGGQRKTACQGVFMFISLTVASVSWWYVEVVPVS